MKRFCTIAYCVIWSLVLWTPLYGCIVTFFNDGPGSVLILDNNANGAGAPTSLSLIGKGMSRRIGKGNEHAHFTVYIKYPKSTIFVSSYEVTQNECSKNGNPRLKLSNIQQNTGDASLFTIVETHRSHEPMVRQLPSLKRADIYKSDLMPSSGCSSCQN